MNDTHRQHFIPLAGLLIVFLVIPSLTGLVLYESKRGDDVLSSSILQFSGVRDACLDVNDSLRYAMTYAGELDLLNCGAQPNDGTGDPLPRALAKIAGDIRKMTPHATLYTRLADIPKGMCISSYVNWCMADAEVCVTVAPCPDPKPVYPP